MSVSRDQIKELLGSGLPPETVASAVGCEPSYVSQLLSEDVFAAEVTALRTVALAAASRRDSSIDAIEDKLLTKLGSMVDEDLFYKPRDILHAWRTVNDAKRRGVVAQHTGNVVNNIVQLSIPESVIRRFTTNRSNEVVQIEGQTVVTMPAHQLLRTLAEKEEAAGVKDGRYKESLNHLPSGLETNLINRPKRHDHLKR